MIPICLGLLIFLKNIVWLHRTTKRRWWLGRWWSIFLRFLDAGSTLAPFVVLAWPWIARNSGGTTVAAVGGNSGTDVATTAFLLCKQLANTPWVQRVALTGLASAMINTVTTNGGRSSGVVFGRVAARLCSNPLLSAAAWIPGILAGILSLACWIHEDDETGIAACARLLGVSPEATAPRSLSLFSLDATTTATTTTVEQHPAWVSLVATPTRYTANALAAWYGCAWLLSLAAGKARKTAKKLASSVSWFLLQAAAMVALVAVGAIAVASSSSSPG